MDVDVLRVSLLGEQAITDGRGGRVQGRSARAVALVAYLVVHAGSPQRRSRIAGLFWPESGDAQALTNLRRELHHLRQLLADEPSLVVTSQDLCWRDTQTCRVDVRVFDRERAAALAAAAACDVDAVLAHAALAIAEYRGDLLPGSYDDWLLQPRTQLERQCVDLCDLLSQTRAGRGDLAGAAEAARRRIQLQPLEETGYRTLMQLQADLGDRAGAVSTYHHCASVLERELGVVPDAATDRAFEHLMTRTRPSAGSAGSAEPSGPSGPSEPSEPPGRRPGRPAAEAAQLVGRSAELALLAQAWATAAAGHGGLVLVRGDAGVGKTRLVAEIAAAARLHGAVVASTQCFGTSGRLALAPVADWLRHDAVQTAAATLDPAWRAEVARLIPDAGHTGPEPGPRPLADAWQRHRFFEGLARALLAARRPTLLVLDNVHWCDVETLAFITFMVRMAVGQPLLVAGTVRDEGLGGDSELEDWTERMRATGTLTEFSLGPLDRAGTARLAEAISSRPLPEADADLLHAATGGFPLYVIEAARSIADPGGPPLPAGDLRTVLRKRFRQASGTARDVAGLAAAVGTDFGLDLLVEASDLDADAVVQAVDELWRRRILREFGDGYDFSHDLLRDTAYAEVSPPKRWLLHRRVGQGLELLHAEDPDAIAAQLADQYARGGRPERAVDYYRRAADVAAGRFGYAEAIRLHRRALAIIAALPAGRGRDARELKVLEALTAPLNARHGYSSPELQQTLERVIALAQSQGRRESTVRGMVGLWTSQFVQGRTAASYQTATRALDLVEAGSRLAGLAHFAVGGSAVSLGRLTEALHHLGLVTQAGPAMLLSIGTRSDIHSMAFAAHAYWLLGRDGDAVAACAEALTLARAAGDPYSLVMALAYTAITDQMRDDRPALGQTVTELRALCDRFGFAYYREWALILDGWSQGGQAGLDLAQQGIAHLKSDGSFARMPYWLSLLADLSARDGRPQAARAALDAALAAGRAHDDVWWLPEVMRARAAYDDEQAAGPRLRAAAALAAEHGSLALLRRCERDLGRTAFAG